MKKLIIAFLIASFVFLMSGCKTQKDLYTENTSSSTQGIDNSSSLIKNLSAMKGLGTTAE